MKAIYIKIGKNVYRVNQDTNIPGSLTFKPSGVTASLDIDRGNKVITQNIFINNLKRPGVKSNGEMYEDMLEFLKTECITEIRLIQNFFKIYVDYSIFCDNREIDRGAVIRPIKPVDKIIPLGIATNNECVYRRVKTFDPIIEFKIANSLPYGIMQTTNEQYKLKINNIAIFQDMVEQPEIHESIYEVGYSMPSSTIASSVNNSKMIYSTESLEIDIQEVVAPFTPRKICLNLDIIIADFICAYNDADVDKILVDNINTKYPPKDDPSVPDNPEDPGIMIPDEDKRPDADGDYTPDDDGYFDWYERCNKTTPHALLVVEDLMPDGKYDLTTMIKISKVKTDIPDIEVGEYVIYREAFSDLV